MMVLCRCAKTWTIACVCVSLAVVVFITLSCDMLLGATQQQQHPQRDPLRYAYDEHYRALARNRTTPLIFIGGVPRSGTTLMRVMLDAHPDVRCGQETRVIPRILGMRTELKTSLFERKMLQNAGVTGEVLDSAVRAFILEVVAKHGPAAPRLCNKDPFALKSAIYLSQQFPRSKFILMIRDGRAVVHSIITRNVTISRFNIRSWPDCLSMWNKAVDKMYTQCLRVGSARCLPVYYEQLVLHPRVWMERVLTFLDLAWSDNVMHHQDFIGQQISLSKVECSSDQVGKPMYRDSLSSWVDKLPVTLRLVMSKLAPMLTVLGYDTRAYPPDYAHPPQGVALNTLHVTTNADLWKTRPRDPFDPDKQGQENSTAYRP